MKITRRQLKRIIKEELLFEIGPGIGMDPTGSTMPVGMKRSEYKQLEAADPENTRLVLSILDPTGLLSIPDLPPAMQAFKEDMSMFNSAMLILSALAVVPAFGYLGRLGSKTLTGAAKALKLSKLKVPPNFAGKADEAAASIMNAEKELVSDINKIKSDLDAAADIALSKPFYREGMPPPRPADWKTFTKGYEDLLKVGAKASKFIPDIAYTVFAKKLLVRIDNALSNISDVKKFTISFKDEIEYVAAGAKSGPLYGGFNSTHAITYDKVIKWWDKIPGNPDGLGVKDLAPEFARFRLADVLGEGGVKVLAEEMLEQFPAMKNVFKNTGDFADEILKLTIRVGGNKSAGGTTHQINSIIDITPWRSSEDFAKALMLKGNILTSFLKNTLQKSKGTWSHEFDHWLRQLSQSRSGVNIKKAWNVDYHLPDGSIDSAKWRSKFFEFEAEFTKAQVLMLDEMLGHGMTDELLEALNSTSTFERYFLQSMSPSWQGPVGKEALKRIRKRLFDTERGLYHSLRRAMDIAPGPRGPLPESLMRNIIRQIIESQ
jgi:hypothetical protein